MGYSYYLVQAQEMGQQEERLVLKSGAPWMASGREALGGPTGAESGPCARRSTAWWSIPAANAPDAQTARKSVSKSAGKGDPVAGPGSEAGIALSGANLGRIDWLEGLILGSTTGPSGVSASYGGPAAHLRHSHSTIT